MAHEFNHDSHLKGTVRITDGTEGTSGDIWTSTDVNGNGSWTDPSTLGLNAGAGLVDVTIPNATIVTAVAGTGDVPVVHGLNSANIVYEVWDDVTKERIFVLAKDREVDPNEFILNFTSVPAGDVIVIVVGGNAAPAVTPSGTVEILDEGTSKTVAVESIDFVGAGVTATNIGNDVTVTISGATGTVAKHADDYVFATSPDTIIINHNLGTADIIIQTVNSVGELVIPDLVEDYDTNTVQVTMATAGTYRVIVTG